MDNEDKRLSEEDLDELDELIEFYQDIEDGHGWKEAVRILAAFAPDPAVVRLVEHRAYDRANEERVCGNPGEAGRFTNASDAFEILAERVERSRVEPKCKCCIDNECECVTGDEEPEVYDNPAEVFAPEPWEAGPDPLEMPSCGS